MASERSVAPTAADFGTRFSAFIIDGVLLFAAQWVVFIVLSRQLQAIGLTSTSQCGTAPSPTCEGPSTVLWVILLVFLLASTVAYYAVLEGRYGATPGKSWMGLQVVDTNGDAPIGMTSGLLRAVVRQAFWLSLFFILDASPLAINLPSALFLVVPVIALAPIVWAAFAVDGRGGHDLAAQTVVVRAASVAANLAPVPVTGSRFTPRSPAAPTFVLSESENAEESS